MSDSTQSIEGCILQKHKTVIFPYDLEQRIWFSVVKVITIYSLEKDRKGRENSEKKQSGEIVNMVSFLLLHHTFSLAAWNSALQSCFRYWI